MSTEIQLENPSINDGSYGGNKSEQVTSSPHFSGSTAFGEGSQVKVDQDRKIDYQEEMVLLFFNSMLDNIVEFTEVLAVEKTVEDRGYEPTYDTQTLSDNAVIFSNKKSDTSRISERSMISGLISGEAKRISNLHLLEEDGNDEHKSKPAAERRRSALQGDSIDKSRSNLRVKSSSAVMKKGSQRHSLRSIGSKGSFIRDKRRSSLGLKRKSASKKDLEKSPSAVGNVETASPSDKEPTEEELTSWFVEAGAGKVIIRFKNGNIYEGEIDRKMFHGKATFRWSDGTVYEGDFSKGSITGNGTMVLPDLGVYEGSFLKGNFHGSGTFNMQATSMIYHGSWKDCKKHGKGWMLYGRNNWYDGEWSADQRHGLGLRQYDTGSRYNGHWHQGARSGQGSMLWENNDFYKGEWSEGMIHGCGKYIWRTIKNNVLAFPSQNYYDGMWNYGMRDGEGMMYFGVDNGAKLRGTWKNNLKEGAGTIVCGNGIIVTNDPLFENDKPIHLYPSDYKSNYSVHDVSASITKKQMKLISHQISTPKISTNIQPVQEGLKAKYYCNPLELSIHTSVAYLEIGYYIDKILQKFTTLLSPPDGFVFEKSKDSSSSFSDFYKNVSSSKWNIFTLSSYGAEINQGVSANYGHSQQKFDYGKYILARYNEEKQMRNLIIKYLPELSQLYSHYAKLTVDSELHFEPIMIRLFLWQFYTDIGIKEMNITLIETDQVLAENEDSAVESRHNPFEPIHFWQFVLSLVGTCWLLCSKNEETDDNPHMGILASLFKKFLDDIALAERPTTKALCLSKYLDLLPMKSVYSLYLEVGNPPTARDFLLHTCVRRKQEILCVSELFQERRSNPVIGSNIVPVGQEIMYFPEHIELGERPKDPVENVPIRTDPFFSSLKTFRVLGAKRILNLLSRVCPQIKSDGIIINIDYPLTFLEFYEALIICATTLLKKEMKAERKADETKENVINPEPFFTQSTNEAQRQSKKQTKEKKQRKN